MTPQPTRLIETWLARQLTPAALAWLNEALAGSASQTSTAAFYKTLGLMPRRLGKADLALTDDDLRQAAASRKGWDPRGWTVDEAGRILAVCRLAEACSNDFPRLFSELCRSAEVGEAIALYRGLPLYPSPERLEPQAAEGLRTNMRAVFEAIAHCNPFPPEQFAEDRWNQMVLKALFIGSRLDLIQGLDARANPALAGILSDYAHERWAAGRSVSPELWRCLGPFAEGRLIDDLKRLAASSDPRERQAAALALSASRTPEAGSLLDAMPELAASVRSGRLTWDTVTSAA